MSSLLQGTFLEATTHDKVVYLQDFQGRLGFEALIEFTLDQKEAGDSILNENLYRHPLHQQVLKKNLHSISIALEQLTIDLKQNQIHISINLNS